MGRKATGLSSPKSMKMVDRVAGLPGNRSTFQRCCALRGKLTNLKGAQMKPTKINLPRLINLLFRGLISFAVLMSVLILAPVMAHALTPVTVAWDANNPVPDGYILYWGTASRNYTNSHDVGDATQYTIPDLQEGVTYYFAATAYDDAGNESAYSDEIIHTVGDPNSNPTTPSVPSGPASGFIQTDYSFSSTASDPENDTLQYQYDWGDGVISGWGNSTQSHTWSSTGNYCVKALARDVHGATSGWSSCGSINITLNTHTIAASAGAYGSITPAGSVVVNNGASQTFTITPAQDFNGTLTVPVTVNDGTVDSAVFNLSVEVTAVNDPPVAVDDEEMVVKGGMLKVAAPGLLENDTDMDGDALTVSTTLVSGLNHGALTLNADGSYEYIHNGTETTSDTFVYRVSDGHGGADTAIVTITITKAR